MIKVVSFTVINRGNTETTTNPVPIPLILCKKAPRKTKAKTRINKICISPHLRFAKTYIEYSMKQINKKEMTRMDILQAVGASDRWNHRSICH